MMLITPCFAIIATQPLLLLRTFSSDGYILRCFDCCMPPDIAMLPAATLACRRLRAKRCAPYAARMRGDARAAISP